MITEELEHTRLLISTIPNLCMRDLPYHDAGGVAMREACEPAFTTPGRGVRPPHPPRHTSPAPGTSPVLPTTTTHPTPQPTLEHHY